jgi:hypothetical protein
MPQLGDRQPVSGPDSPLLLIGRQADRPLAAASPLSSQSLPRDPNDAAIWLPGQGRANACGTTSLAYSLRYLLGPSAPSRADIDAVIRRANIFTAPRLMVRYARKLGLAARAYNDASRELLFELVDRGVPVLVLTDTTPLNLRDTANLHWVVLLAHYDGKVAIYNPHGFQEELDLASFERHWQQASIFGLPAWRRFAIALSRDPAALPPASRSGLSLFGADLAAQGVATLVNSATSLWVGGDGRVAQAARSLGGMVGGALQTAMGALALLAGAVRTRGR